MAVGQRGTAFKANSAAPAGHTRMVGAAMPAAMEVVARASMVLRVVVIGIPLGRKALLPAEASIAAMVSSPGRQPDESAQPIMFWAVGDGFLFVIGSDVLARSTKSYVDHIVPSSASCRAPSVGKGDPAGFAEEAARRQEMARPQGSPSYPGRTLDMTGARSGIGQEEQFPPPRNSSKTRLAFTITISRSSRSSATLPSDRLWQLPKDTQNQGDGLPHPTAYLLAQRITCVGVELPVHTHPNPAFRIIVFGVHKNLESNWLAVDRDIVAVLATYEVVGIDIRT